VRFHFLDKLYSKTNLLDSSDAFGRHSLILVQNGSHTNRVPSSLCVWGGPPLTFKRNVKLYQQYYLGNDTLRTLFRSILCIGHPNWNDLVNELRCLKANAMTTASQVEAIYVHMFTITDVHINMR
jgi:hypothetical protein